MFSEKSRTWGWGSLIENEMYYMTAMYTPLLSMLILSLTYSSPSFLTFHDLCMIICQYGSGILSKWLSSFSLSFKSRGSRSKCLNLSVSYDNSGFGIGFIYRSSGESRVLDFGDVGSLKDIIGDFMSRGCSWGFVFSL